MRFKLHRTVECIGKLSYGWWHVATYICWYPTNLYTYIVVFYTYTM
ncbi:unnamed protein product [Arabidopsis halleri]